MPVMTEQPGTATASASKARAAAAKAKAPGCCPLYHEAIELIGKRWTGAIVLVMMSAPRRFREISQAVPELSDRLLSERMKELEAKGVIARRVLPGPPVKVEYELTDMGWALEPTVRELESWAQH